MNLDAILESVLHRLVVRPLKAHLDKLFVDYFTKTGAIKLLSDNINYAGTRPPQELAIKQKITLPSETALKTIEEYLTRLCNADSPLEKLEFLLAAIAAIFNSVSFIAICSATNNYLFYLKVKTSQLGTGRTITLGADDFLPLFVWVLVKTKFLTAEIEAEYMWGNDNFIINLMFLVVNGTINPIIYDCLQDYCTRRFCQGRAVTTSPRCHQLCKYLKTLRRATRKTLTANQKQM